MNRERYRKRDDKKYGKRQRLMNMDYGNDRNRDRDTVKSKSGRYIDIDAR